MKISTILFILHFGVLYSYVVRSQPNDPRFILVNGSRAVNLGKVSFSTPEGFRSPSVLMQTRTFSPLQRVGGKTMDISISDNGPGIPDSIKDKIFQPFFTTKPTGQGTGLGLSLSYDIIKAHGGDIRVESKEEEGTTMIIQLPAS